MAVLRHSFFIPLKMNYCANNEKAKISPEPSTIWPPSQKPLIYKDFHFYFTAKTIW